MKATIQTISGATLAEKSPVAVFCELIKVRLSFLVLLTTLVGFYVGTQGPVQYPIMIATLLGTGLLAFGAAALNQLIEKDLDARMHRTEDRPLPSGRVQPEMALVLGGAFSVAGMLVLALRVNLLTSSLGALCLLSYLFVYTPLKRVTWLNTAVGAVPGALPPLMGWTAARDQLSGEGWTLFAILFFWQIPHFLAIAWIYRQDYARAGFMMLPVIDPRGGRTGHYALSHTLGLLVASLCPVIFGLCGRVYLGGSLLLGVVFAGCAVLFARDLTLERARRLFLFSIVYLPLLLGLLVLDKVPQPARAEAAMAVDTGIFSQIGSSKQ